MAQSKRVVEAEASKKQGEENITAQTSDDLIAQLQEDSKKRNASQKKKKIEEYKATQATRDILFSRLGKI